MGRPNTLAKMREKLLFLLIVVLVVPVVGVSVPVPVVLIGMSLLWVRTDVS